jgi:hypothetical protein
MPDEQKTSIQVSSAPRELFPTFLQMERKAKYLMQQTIPQKESTIMSIA